MNCWATSRGEVGRGLYSYKHFEIPSRVLTLCGRPTCLFSPVFFHQFIYLPTYQTTNQSIKGLPRLTVRHRLAHQSWHFYMNSEWLLFIENGVACSSEMRRRLSSSHLVTQMMSAFPAVPFQLLCAVDLCAPGSYKCPCTRYRITRCGWMSPLSTVYQTYTGSLDGNMFSPPALSTPQKWSE